jgi:glycosyltransferase involved in cell wall biosynthesis
MRIGGTEMVIKNIIEGFDTNEFSMSVLCIEGSIGPFAEELQHNGTQIFQLQRQPGFDSGLIMDIKKIIKTHNIALVHCHQYTPWVYGTIAAAFSKTKVIFTEHGRFYPDSSTWKRKLINPVLNFFTDQVTAISKATKQALVEFENIPDESIDVIYNGIAPLEVDQEEVKKLRVKLAIPEEHTILGTIARFDPIKNHIMMLKAFSLVLEESPNSTLIIVGDGEERANIEHCIKNLEIENNVIVTGYIAKPQNYLALMDIYLLSSLSEGTSMTLLEAMSLSKPCVVTNAGGNTEIIKEHENGLSSENDNFTAFTKNIIQLLSFPSVSKKYSTNALKRFNRLFTNDKMVTFYKKTYRKLL